jgi:hypothetical protein
MTIPHLRCSQNLDVQQGLKRLQDEHARNMAEIKALLSSINTKPAPQSQPLPQAEGSAPKVVISDGGGEPSVRRMSRWSQMAGSVETKQEVVVEEAQESGSAVVEEDFSGAAKGPRFQPIAKLAVQAKRLVKHKEPAPTPATDISITFSRKFNDSLVDYQLDGVTVSVPRYSFAQRFFSPLIHDILIMFDALDRNISVDDLIFELRRAVADKVLKKIYTCVFVDVSF